MIRLSKSTATEICGRDGVTVYEVPPLERWSAAAIARLGAASDKDTAKAAGAALDALLVEVPDLAREKLGAYEAGQILVEVEKASHIDMGGSLASVS